VLSPLLPPLPLLRRPWPRRRRHLASFTAYAASLRAAWHSKPGSHRTRVARLQVRWPRCIRMGDAASKRQNQEWPLAGFSRKACACTCGARRIRAGPRRGTHMRITDPAPPCTRQECPRIVAPGRRCYRVAAVVAASPPCRRRQQRQCSGLCCGSRQGDIATTGTALTAAGG
jgi:hypothetical protein